MKRFAFIAAALTLLLVVAGCNGGGGGSGSGGGSAPTTPFLGGTKGLEIDFLEGSPPEEVTDGGTFDFQAIVSLRNEGEFKVERENAEIDLIGFLPSDFGVGEDELRDKNPEDDLTAKRRDSEGNIIEPVETFVTFPNSNEFFNFDRSISGNTVFVFRADVCYKYQTQAVSRLCVLSDLINVDDDEVCDPSESKTIFSSASPLQVRSFRQSVAGQDKVQFSFDVIHSGNGEIFKEGDSDSPPADCPRNPREKREKEDKVLVEVDTGLPNLRCVGLESTTSGFVTLVDGRRTVTCTQELEPGRNDFETNVDITLDFNYRDDTEQEVLVKHLVDDE